MTVVAAVGRFCCSRWGPRWLPWLCRCVARCTDAGVRGSTTGLRMKGWCVTQVPPWSCYPLCIMNAPDMLCLFNENTNQPGFLLHWPPSLAPNSICVKPSALIVAPAWSLDQSHESTNRKGVRYSILPHLRGIKDSFREKINTKPSSESTHVHKI